MPRWVRRFRREHGQPRTPPLEFSANSMKRKYLAFDIETAKVLPANDHDWRAHRPLGIACAATFLSDAPEPLVWYGGTNRRRPADRMNRIDLSALVNYLVRQTKNGYTIPTWNGVGFDLDVVAEESGMFPECRQMARNHVDMMFHLLCLLGYGVSLASAAKGMDLPAGKQGMTGASAPRAWAEGEREEVLDYVTRDVRITMELVRSSEARGFLCWIARSGRKRQIVLPKGWLTVRSAERMPQPVTSWMMACWFRKKFTAWLR